ncbi:MAG: quinolinate synthase NadA [Candidatus Hadarchaeales archaeon]
MRKVDEIVEKIVELKEKKKAVILAHNYQIPEIQDLADFVGDSLELALACTKIDKNLVVFCGVDFMAETASILNPEKKVLIPDVEASCPLAAQLPLRVLLEKKKEHPGVPVVLYVNTTAEAKAEADVICTSANAPSVINSLDEDVVLFGPDRNLAWFTQQKTKKTVIPVPYDGYCYVHRMFKVEDILLLKQKYPDAEILAHPECDPEIQQIATHVCSTSQMIKRARESNARTFIIATEIGLLHRLKKENPDKKFIPACPDAICQQMKKHTLEKLYISLRDEKYEIKVPEKTAERARRAIERMFSLTRIRQD